MSQYTIDHVQRMKQIKASLDSEQADAAAVQQKEVMLDELMDIVDNIDHARGQHPYPQHALLACTTTLRIHSAQPARDVCLILLWVSDLTLLSIRSCCMRNATCPCMQNCTWLSPFRLFMLMPGQEASVKHASHACVLKCCMHADLHTIGGLPTLLKLLQDPEASVRWRAAEVVATCVQNNPPVQQVRTPAHQQHCGASCSHDRRGPQVCTLLDPLFPRLWHLQSRAQHFQRWKRWCVSNQFGYRAIGTNISLLQDWLCL